jgi:hypothetical protein
VGPGLASRPQCQFECGERRGDRFLFTLARVRAPKEGVQAADQSRASLKAIFAVGSERDCAVVVDEGPVFNEVSETHPGRAKTEVDFLAVPATERRLIELATLIDRLPGHEHAEADTRYHLGSVAQAVLPNEVRALVDPRMI